MRSEVDISIVVSIAAALVLFSLVLSAVALSRMSDAQSRRGMAWLFATNSAFLVGTMALLFAPALPFWLSSALVILGAKLGIVFGNFALCAVLEVPPRIAEFLGIVACAVTLQAGIAAALDAIVPLMLTSSAFNGVLAGAIALRLWPRARPYGLEYAILAALPFVAIAASYLFRLALIGLGATNYALLLATLVITFMLAFAALQWCYSVIAYRAARLNRHLEQERLRAEEASRLKSQFLANMSHELRTPLNGILGMAQALRARVSAHDEREMVQTIESSGETLLVVLNDILDIAKIESGRMELEPVPFAPVEMLERIARLHRLTAEAKGVRFTVELGEGLGGIKLGDPTRITQILNKLLSNAVKFTEQGTVRLSAEGDERGLRLWVADTGIGMSPDQVEATFGEFVQADATITRRYGGTGLGLAIAKRLTDRMGGSLRIDTAPGVGTTVTLELALPPGAAENPTLGHDASCNLPSGLRILMAEDNRTNQLVIRAMLRDTSVKLTVVENGTQAVERALGAAFDVYLFDISMPEMDGCTALRTIRQRRAPVDRETIPAIALTAHVMDHHVEEYLAAGFCDHIGKPVQRDHLLEKISKNLKFGAAGAPDAAV